MQPYFNIFVNVLNDAEYSKRLIAAGVYNELHLAKGAIHAFFTFPGITIQYHA